MEARWHEHYDEHRLRNNGIGMKRAGSGLLVNTPIQLYLAHSRLTRAQLESASTHSKLMEQDIGRSLQQGVIRFFDSFLRYTNLPSQILTGACMLDTLTVRTAVPLLRDNWIDDFKKLEPLSPPRTTTGTSKCDIQKRARLVPGRSPVSPKTLFQKKFPCL